MKKMFLYLVCVLLVMLLGVVIYRYLISPTSYEYETAIKNGDVVSGPNGNANVDKLYKFVENVESMNEDKIRITVYTHEGDAIIFDLEYYGKVIKCTKDSRRDSYGSKTNEYGEYTKIQKEEANNLTNYYLFDETSKYENLYIFQE